MASPPSCAESCAANSFALSLQRVDLLHKALPRKALLQRRNLLRLTSSPSAAESSPPTRPDGFPASAAVSALSRNFSSSAAFAFADVHAGTRNFIHPSLSSRRSTRSGSSSWTISSASYPRWNSRQTPRCTPLACPSHTAHWVFSSICQPSRAINRAARIMPRRVLDEPVVAHQPQLAVLDVRHAVQRVHQQPIRARHSATAPSRWP